MEWIGCVCCKKIPTQLCGTNFCTCSTRFALSFVRQPNGSEYIQIVWTHQNISLWSNGVDRLSSLQKIPTRLLGTNICTSSARFAPRFVRQPNGPKCTQIVWNTPKQQFRVQLGGPDVFVVKNSDATSCTNFCTSSARFAPSFIRQPNGPECTQIVRNAPKH